MATMENKKAKTVLVSHLDRNKLMKIPEHKTESDLMFLDKSFRQLFSYSNNVSIVVSFQRFDSDWDEYIELSEDDVIQDKDKLKAIVLPLMKPTNTISSDELEPIPELEPPKQAPHSPVKADKKRLMWLRKDEFGSTETLLRMDLEETVGDMIQKLADMSMKGTIAATYKSDEIALFTTSGEFLERRTKVSSLEEESTLLIRGLDVCWSYNDDQAWDTPSREVVDAEEEQATKMPRIQEMDLDAEVQYVDPDTIILTTNEGHSDYASCAGKYTRVKFATIRGRPIYRNAARARFMFFTGGNWVITANQYIFVIMEGGTGGFYGSRHTYGPVHAVTRDGNCQRKVSIWDARYSLRVH